MKFVALLTICLISLSASAWDGTEQSTGDMIEIEKGNLVREGEEIEVFNYSTGTYKYYDVEQVSSDEVEVFDWEAGEYKTLDMDD